MYIILSLRGMKGFNVILPAILHDSESWCLTLKEEFIQIIWERPAWKNISTKEKWSVMTLEKVVRRISKCIQFTRHETNKIKKGEIDWECSTHDDISA
jgi:hypothetical protein